jgi:hypothetical protein
MAEQASAGPKKRPRLKVLWLWLPLLALVALWFAYGLARFNGFRLGIGTIFEPTPDSLRLAAVMSALGIPATYLATRLWLVFFTQERWTQLRAAFTELDRKQAIWALGALGTLVPVLIRHAVLDGAPLTDDESSYLLAARTLASGRLWVPSPEMPVFFDNAFIINDGRLYSQYFLGWPALLALGVWVSLPGLVNPLLAGLTTVLLALIAERRFGTIWGLIAGLLHVASPFLMVGAATQMSHTSCTFALTLLLWAVERCAAGRAPVGYSALAVGSMCLAFWTRPATALGYGLPLIGFWLWSLRQQERPLKHLAMALGVSIVPALLFLWVNHQLTGSPWHTGYHAGVAHAAATQHRVASFNGTQVAQGKYFYFFVDVVPSELLSKYVFVLMRLWTDAYGFPIGLALALFATREGARRLLAPALGLLLAHVTLPDPGIDTFGPVHFTEMMISIVLLCTDGLRSLQRIGRRLGLHALAPSLIAASCACGLVFYCVPRFTTLALLAADIRSPMEAFASAPEGSVVFSPLPFGRPCLARPARHFVLFRPNNDPDFDGPRLWANHVDLTTDRKLVEALGRKGFLLRYLRKTCQVELVPLEQASAAMFPPAFELLPGDLGEVPRKP